jgi:tetratricopeptide (TPR) repeat protein
MDKAIFHFKQSLMASLTAEAWRSTGLCTYRKAQLERRGGGPSERTAPLLREALSYLTEANLLDKARPQINAHLVMCAVQLGQVHAAKQALREVLRHADMLDHGTALELAQILLEFSDESTSRLAGRESERGWLAKDGRYAREAASVAAVLLTKRQSAEAHFIMGRARALLGEHAEAVGCFCAALELCDAESSSLGPAADAARDSASRLAAEPAYADAVEEAISRAEWPRLDHTPSSGGTPVGRLSG